MNSLQVPLPAYPGAHLHGQVVGDEEANRFLRRPYRTPWAHPEPANV